MLRVKSIDTRLHDLNLRHDILLFAGLRLGTGAKLGLKLSVPPSSSSVSSRSEASLTSI